MFRTKIVEVEKIIVDEEKIKELRATIAQMEKDFESEKKILNNELKIKIDEAIKEKEKENNTLSREKAVLEEKVKILEKAFQNMGFDVKDMKEILNKLVDGIVSKNEINIVK